MLKSSSRAAALFLVCLVLVLSVGNTVRIGNETDADIINENNIKESIETKALNNLPHKAKNESHKAETIVYKPIGNDVYSPVDVTYVTKNPIDILEIDESLNENERLNYFQISGIKDKEIENKINAQIKELYDNMVKYIEEDILPPYRGIENAFKDMKREYYRLDIEPMFNHNNILSICADLFVRFDKTNANVYRNYKSNYYGYDGSEPINSYSIYETLNFDLNTGNTFLLEDVFTNDADGLSIVNKAIINSIEMKRLDNDFIYDFYGESPFELVKRYEGISSGQKFYIDDLGIQVVIDYNNPEFNVGFRPAVVNIPFFSTDLNIAILKRFYNKDKAIYENKPTEMELLNEPYSNIIAYGGSFEINGKYYYENIKKHKSIGTKFDYLIQSMRENFKNKDNPSEYNYLYINAYRVGSYVFINYYDNENINLVFKITGEPIELRDIFVEGFDYLSLIKMGFEKYISEDNENKEVDIEELKDKLSFTLDSGSIYFNAETDYIYYHYGIPFEEIGYENLRIFEE